MAISDLLRYRDDVIARLQQFTIPAAINNDTVRLDNLIGTHPVNSTFAKVEQVKDKLLDLSNNFILAKQQLSEVLVDIDELIDREIKVRYSYPDVSSLSEYPDSTVTISNLVDEQIQACIQKHANHYYPALQFGCTPYTKQLVTNLVANDPLYLCDRHEERINILCEQFNDIYKRRLRKYPLTQYELEQLPNSQFGFVISWMLFNYTNFATVTHYLEKIIKLLRPGGHYLFSYNNCDLLDSCLTAERGIMSFISKRHLVKACENIGYEIVNSYDIANDDAVKYISWIEIKKPGELSTVKRRQVLGAIYQK